MFQFLDLHTFISACKTEILKTQNKSSNFEYLFSSEQAQSCSEGAPLWTWSRKIESSRVSRVNVLQIKVVKKFPPKKCWRNLFDRFLTLKFNFQERYKEKEMNQFKHPTMYKAILIQQLHFLILYCRAKWTNVHYINKKERLRILKCLLKL